MGHIHKVYDNDIHFKIDAVTRVVKNASETKAMIVQHDHNSERFTFEIPRMVDGHDMSTCNVVQVHYINTDSADKNTKETGVYEVDDLQVSPDNEDVVICSWLISGNATKHVGKLSFIVRFVCSTEGQIDYAWNTAVHSNVFISSGINNSDDVVEEYADVLEQWREELFSGSGGGSGGASLMIVEVDGERASHNASEIYNHVQSGGAVIAKNSLYIFTLDKLNDYYANFVNVSGTRIASLSVDVNGAVTVTNEQWAKDYTLPIGGDQLGGVKNGGNVTINADGTMNAPTVPDAHINSLIDTKLGVIENGSY